jgi:hypothetical protein
MQASYMTPKNWRNNLALVSDSPTSGVATRILHLLTTLEPFGPASANVTLLWECSGSVQSCQDDSSILQSTPRAL